MPRKGQKPATVCSTNVLGTLLRGGTSESTSTTKTEVKVERKEGLTAAWCSLSLYAEGPSVLLSYCPGHLRNPPREHLQNNKVGLGWDMTPIER